MYLILLLVNNDNIASFHSLYLLSLVYFLIGPLGQH